MTDWTEKYRPTTLSEVRGNNSARDDLKEWAETWDDHREAVIIYGSPGVGKTSAAHALANDMGWPVIELNASDQRTGDIIDRVAGEAAKSSTLTQAKEGEPGRRLVIMDEADNIHGTYDRGGARAVTSIVKEASQPMVLIANDFYDMSRGLRNACQSIEFRDVSARSIVPVLRDLCRKEGIEFDEDALERIAEQNSGDLRGAVKDLQAIADGRDAIAIEDVTSGERDTTKGIFEFLDSVLKEDDPEDALYLTYDVDETPDDLLLWAEDKVPKVYDAGELARAYDYLARADRWLGRVRATQNYAYWRYATDNIAAGVAAARDETRGGWTRYGGAPYRSSKDKTRDEVATQIAQVAGVSTATARRDIVPFLAVMTHHCKNRDLTVRMAARYEFGTSEVAFVTGSGEPTNKVQSVVEDAEELRGEAAEEHGGDVFMERVEEAAAESESAQDESGSVDAVDDDVLAEDEAESDEEPTEPDDDSQSGLSDFM
ncbi:replication factor C large subunit [Halosegnis longus]|uniref:replication factor C large subunit n=1 Tax=Halosegnis longus TaxID=2216012 RepID=UPI00129DB150|nr:replication factor C large subunit [Halosegnis longus]